MSLGDNIPGCWSGIFNQVHKPTVGMVVKVGCVNNEKMTFCKIHSKDGSRQCEIRSDARLRKCRDQKLTYAGQDVEKDCYFIISSPYDRCKT